MVDGLSNDNYLFESRCLNWLLTAESRILKIYHDIMAHHKG